MSFESHLYDVITAAGATDAATNFWFNEAGERTPTPYVVMTRIASRPISAMEGNPSNFHRWVYQFAVFSPDKDQAEKILRQIVAFLGAFEESGDGSGIRGVIEEGSRSAWSEERRLYYYMADLLILEDFAA
jgi:hypothetical protein